MVDGQNEQIEKPEKRLQVMESKPRSTIVWGTALVLLVLPLILSAPLATEILIWGIFGLGFNLLLGYTGVLSFGHAAYFGLGAYSTGLALRYWHAGLGTSLLLSVVLSLLFYLVSWILRR